MVIGADTSVVALQNNVITPSQGPASISIYRDDPDGSRIPLYYLPYNDDCNYRITLADKQGIGNVNFSSPTWSTAVRSTSKGRRTSRPFTTSTPRPPSDLEKRTAVVCYNMPEI